MTNRASALDGIAAAQHPQAPDAKRSQHDLRQAILVALWMAACALAAWWFTPTHLMADQRPKLTLEQQLPKAFGDWRIDTTYVATVVNPQQNELVNKLYSEVVTRTYVNRLGQRLMLSLAYGRDQRDTLALHYPEVCYPAQGFRVLSNKAVTLTTRTGPLAVRILETSLNDQRFEPVTYWTTLGDEVVRGGIEKKLAEARYGFRGVVADGLLFRVSSIDRDSVKAFDLHRRFVDQLLDAMDTSTRRRVAGLP